MRRARAQVILLLAVFVGLGAALARTRSSSDQEHAWVRHTYEVELALGAVRDTLSDAEAGRGDWRAVRASVDDVCALTSDSDIQQRHCAELRETLGAHDAGAARAVIGRMRSTEQRYLATRSAAYERSRSAILLLARLAFALALGTTLWLVLQRERRRRAYEEQSAFFESVVECIGEGVVAADSSGKIVVANARARELFPLLRTGMAVRELAASSGFLDADGAPLGPREGPLSRAIAGEAVDEFLFSARSIWVKGSSRVVRDAGGAILGAVAVCRDVTAEKKNDEDARALAVTDALTGCYNRRGFFMLGEQHARVATRTRAPFTVVFADLDGLKEINDVLGHESGDEAIASTARILRTALRESDILARLGGDEFVMLATQADARGTTALVARIQQAVARHNESAPRAYQIAMSFGCATFDPESPQTLNELVAEADRKMYGVKRSRRRVRSVTDPGRTSVPSIKISIRTAS